jgi:anaerobic selenocysteine-containing dehydrogenase
MSELGRALNQLDDPRVMALVVYNSNPAAIAPDQNTVLAGLARQDLFLVAIEQFLTDTASFADFVLPTTTFLEHTDLYLAYGHYYLQLARPALPAPGATKPNVEIFRLLAQQMGFAEPCFADSEDNMIRQLLDSDHPFLSGITLERLEQQHWVRLRVAHEGEPFLPFATGGFGTPDARCNLNVDDLDYTPPVESRLGETALRSRFPLELITPKADDAMNSTFGNRPSVDEQTGILSLHGEDAAPRGIVTGDAVRIFNTRGSITLRAEVNGRTRPGVVAATSVRWNRHAPDRRNANVLTSPRLTDMGGGPVFYSCLVQVEKCGD